MATTVDKPTGLTVFPLHDDPGAPCVLSGLLEREPWRGELDWPDGFAGGIAHRLDRHTSGALLVADSPDELVAIRGAFAAGAFRKTYRMLSDGDVPWHDNHCERPIAHARRNRRRMVVQRGANTAHRGRWYPADTRFERLDRTLWEVTITTGVMHQIRVHAAFLGLALRGDTLYGGGPGDRFWLHHVGLTGPFRTDARPLPSWAATTRRR